MHSPRSQLDTMTVQRECTAPRRLIGDGSAEEQSDTIREEQAGCIVAEQQGAMAGMPRLPAR